jgi:hypothetical protein
MYGCLKNSIQEVCKLPIYSPTRIEATYPSQPHLKSPPTILLTVIHSPLATLRMAMPSRASLTHVHPAAAQRDELRLAQVKAM